MMQRVHAPEKRSCCPSRQKESGQFAARGFARRGEDNELEEGLQARPISCPNFTDISIFPPVQAKPQPNRTGMPDRLKAGIESLSGIDMSDVRVHANSPKPVSLNALAYTQGNQIYLGPGQKRHLPHEAWHAVQQKQGRVRATGQMMGYGVNDNPRLETEADMMASKVLPGNAIVTHKKGGEEVLSFGCGEKGTSHLSGHNSVTQLKEKHIIKRETTPYIHDFTEEAIDRGAPCTLNYWPNKNSEVYVQDINGELYFKNSMEVEQNPTMYSPISIYDVNRKKALLKGVQLMGKSKSYEHELSRDEYPYASTLEGGTDSYWAFVPKSEQSIQGGQLSRLYDRLKNSGELGFDVKTIN